MSAIASNRPKSTTNPLERRIPKNPKYDNVQSTIDTGDSLTKYLKRVEEERASSKQQAGEIFKRMKISTLVQLIIQVAEINGLETTKVPDRENSFQPTDRTLTDRPQTQDSQISMESSRSTLQSVIRGVGEMDVYKGTQTRPALTPINEHLDLEYHERPYLLVDLRDKDDFRMNHIVSAHHYPAAMLSRCSNNESRELLLYKNHKGKIILLYDDDERIAPQAATVMVERGYNNIFLLSGGLRYAIQKFPQGLITGSCPVSWTVPQTAANKTRRPQSTNSHQKTVEPPVGQSAASLNRPAPVRMISFEARDNFTTEDIEQLNFQLEKILLPTENNSRLSRAQSQSSKQSSRASIASERSNLSNVSEKPWKP